MEMKDVKRIRLDPDPLPLDQISENEYRERMLKFMEQIDWKMWEILKIMKEQHESRKETDGI